MASFASQYSPSEAPNVHSLLALLPCFQSLRFEKILARLKRRLNASRPHYGMFYDVSAGLNAIALERTDTGEPLRLRPIFLRFLGLYCGCDLAKATRNVRMDSHPSFRWTKRKGRQYHQHQPVHQVCPTQYCAHHALMQYFQCTAYYRGTALFVSLGPQHQPSSADRLNLTTTSFLVSQGLSNYTAHSTSAYCSRGGSLSHLCPWRLGEL